MNSKVKLFSVVVGAVLALAARADDELRQIELEEGAQPSRWLVSAGVRLDPGVKTHAVISSRAAVEAAGRLRAEKGSRGAADGRTPDHDPAQLRDHDVVVLGERRRHGDTEMDYEAGLVRGTVELARYTLRAGVGVEF